jgi:hypothetical protein
LQDEILALIGALIYLSTFTGGRIVQALLNHRYSDDLALFVNSHPEIRGIVDVIEKLP